MEVPKNLDSTDLKQESVQFTSGPNRITGMLTLPEGSGGPHPAAVFVAGSGPADRDGSGLYTPMFEEFARRGIASFSWDKPGVGESTGHFMAQSFEDRAAEVASAIECLRSRDDIDSSRIGMWGISQAGWVMPQVYQLVPDVAFVIAVSVPVSTVNEQNVFRVQNSFPADGFTEAQTARAIEMIERLGVMLETDATAEDGIDALSEYRDEPWLEAAVGKTEDLARGFEFAKRIAVFDVRPFVSRVTCPVLGIFGEKDRLVNVEESVDGYRLLLADAGNQDVTLRVFPNANHSIALAETGGQLEMARMAESGERVLAPGYVELMGEWVAERVGRE